MEDRVKRRQMAERILALRAKRTNFLPLQILGEPAWDILLELYVAALDGHKLSPADFNVGVPPSTFARWLRTLENAGLVTSARGAIGQHALYWLTEKGRYALDGLFETLTADLMLR